MRGSAENAVSDVQLTDMLPEIHDHCGSLMKQDEAVRIDGSKVCLAPQDGGGRDDERRILICIPIDYDHSRGRGQESSDSP